ncbi:PolC-type DNA polymerase III, partial [Intestinibacter bartlettii]
KYSQGFSLDDEETYLHFRTTDEMLEEFKYLGEELAYEVVVENTNKVADMVEDFLPIPNETFPPVIEGSDTELREMCYNKAKRIYGDPMPEVVKKRLDRELNSIISNGYAVMYIIAQKLVTKSLADGYLVGSRGSVGSSLAATMSDITEVNPLPAHYICENEDCKYSYFYAVGEWGSGVDLPDKDCPKCGRKLKKDGHDIPFEVFLGFEGDKEPDIDLNFSGSYQPVIHKYTEELFGEGHVYRAGTIGTVADKTAYGYAKKYVEENDLDVPSAEVLRLAKGCTGVKRTSGQHPGGVMVIPNYKEVYDITPIQYPANDVNCGVITTHFDYHSISGRILKLDILGHDVPTIIRMIEDITGLDATTIPLDDKETMSIFTSTEALGVTPEEINCPIGSLAIPEFGTSFVRQMLLDTKPTTFAELVRISGLSHGTDVWLNNAQDLVVDKVVEFKDVISTRDDIMNYLLFKGLPPKMAFTIMENVRKGKGLKPEFIEEMNKHNVPQWYVDSCQKIKYMFPKAHAVAYVMMSFRLAYYKVHYPAAFYATYFTTKAQDFDADLIVGGLDSIKQKINEIHELGNDATAKDKTMLTVLEVALEMYARKIKIIPVDIYKSDATKFIVVDDSTILPPMIALQGVGENAAINIQKERENGEFISKEDLRKRTKISKTVVETLSNHGSLNDMSEKNQLSLF